MKINKGKRDPGKNNIFIVPKHQAQMLLIPDDVVLHGKDQVAQSSVHGVVVEVFLSTHSSTRRSKMRQKINKTQEDMDRKSHFHDLNTSVSILGAIIITGKK